MADMSNNIHSGTSSKDAAHAKPAKVTDIFSYINSHVQNLNQSKLFAAMMIIIVNIASRFVTFKFSKSMEGYLRYTFSKQAIVFAAAWMGTRDLYIAIGITVVFAFAVDHLCNEESAFCCLPESFREYHGNMFETNNNGKISDDEIAKARLVVERHTRQKEEEEEEAEESTTATGGTRRSKGSNKNKSLTSSGMDILREHGLLPTGTM